MQAQLGLIAIYRKLAKFWRDGIARKTMQLNKVITFAFLLSLGRHLYRYSKLSCSPCEEGMVQEFHDLLRETFCCNHADLCNNGNINVDTTVKFGKEIDKMTEAEQGKSRQTCA